MKKKILLSAIALASVASIVACTPEGNSSTSSSEPSSSVSVDTTFADQDMLDYVLEGSDVTEIEFWHSFGTGPTPFLEGAVAAFEEHYNNKINVTLTSKGGYDNLKEAVVYEIPTTNTPDVVIGYPDHFAEYLAGDIMEPLDQYMNSTLPEVGIIEGSTNAKNDFLSNYMVENQQFVEGVTYGLPFNKSTEVLVYNKTFFEAHDLTVPTTWAEVETTSQAIYNIVMATSTETGTGAKCGVDTVSGLDFSKVLKADFYPMSYDSQANFFITLCRQWGATYTEIGESFQDGYIKYNDAKVVAALDFIKSMYTNHLYASPAQWEESYASTPFIGLKTVMSVGSSAGMSYNVPAGDIFTVATAPVPYNATTGIKAVIQQGTNIAMLNNNTEEERLASWLLIRWLTAYCDEDSTDNPAGETDQEYLDPNAYFGVGASYLPVRTSGRTSQFYQDLLAIETSLTATSKEKLVANSAKTATEGYTDFTAFTDAAFIGSSEVRSVVDTIIPAITNGARPVQDVINDTYAQLLAYQE